MSIITIVGAGMMGSAISWPASENKNEVRLVGTHLDRAIIDHAVATGWHTALKRRLPEGIGFYQIESVKEALDGADIVVGGVSSFGVDWFSEKIIPIIPDGIPILSVTKGMQHFGDGALVSYPRLYAQRFPGRALSINAVGGPCTSYALADRDQTAVCFCGDDMQTLGRLKKAFETPYYHISLSCDVTGVECAVAMKNAYALGVTLAVGLSERADSAGGDRHYNAQAALFGQGVREMRKLLKHLGGHDDNIVYGAGDLYVTIFGGRSRKMGTLLGKGLRFSEATRQMEGVTLESVLITKRTAAAIRALIGRGVFTENDFPLLLHIDDMISFGAAVNIPWDKFVVSDPGTGS